MADQAPAAPEVRVEELPRGRRVWLAGPHMQWMLALPSDSYEFDVMQYQVCAADAARSAVLELKLDGPTYRLALNSVRENAPKSDVIEAVRVLLGPVMSLLGVIDEKNLDTDVALEFPMAAC